MDGTAHDHIFGVKPGNSDAITTPNVKKQGVLLRKTRWFGTTTPETHTHPIVCSTRYVLMSSSAVITLKLNSRDATFACVNAKEIKFAIEFLGEKHLKSNMKRSFDTRKTYFSEKI